MRFKYDKGLINSLNWKKVLSIILVVVFGILLIGVLGFRQWYSYNLKPVSNEPSDVITVIEPGSSRTVIGDQLENMGIIRSSTAFNWYIRSNNVSQSLQAGTYKFSPSFSTQKIVDMLVNGKVDTNLVTISPGQRLDGVVANMVKAGFAKEDVSKALEAKYNHPLFASKPDNTSLEGYIFPETYQITAQDTASDVLRHSFSVFYERITDNMMTGITKQGLNLYEAITLASIVQQEALDPETQRQVAQVFLKRLNEGMALGSDVTVKYAAKSLGVKPTIDLDSPYNTRVYAGLPPGPISNFKISALEAVANPAGGDYLFFVADDNGNVHFAKTLAEHEANAAKYCGKGCEL